MNEDEPLAVPPQNRRDVLIKGLTGAMALAGLGMRGTILAANNGKHLTPGVTEGPYWVDELLIRSDVRKDPTTGIVQVGVPLKLEINVSQLTTSGKVSPIHGAYVDIWQCNALGIYSDEAVEGTSGEKFLRGCSRRTRRGTSCSRRFTPDGTAVGPSTSISGFASTTRPPTR